MSLDVTCLPASSGTNFSPSKRYVVTLRLVGLRLGLRLLLLRLGLLELGLVTILHGIYDPMRKTIVAGAANFW